MRLYRGNEPQVAPVEKTDAQLAREAGQGDARAFGVLVERYRAALVGYMAGLLCAREEVAQEAFLRAWQETPALQDPSTFGGWLYRIARNLATSRARRPRPVTLTADPPARETSALNRTDTAAGSRHCLKLRNYNEFGLFVVFALILPRALRCQVFWRKCHYDVEGRRKPGHPPPHLRRTDFMKTASVWIKCCLPAVLLLLGISPCSADFRNTVRGNPQQGGRRIDIVSLCRGRRPHDDATRSGHRHERSDGACRAASNGQEWSG